MGDFIIAQDREKDLKIACVRSVKHFVDLANRKLHQQMPYPAIEFGLRGTTAGRAWFVSGGRNNKIQFQPEFLYQNAEDFLTQTAGHEVGHLVAHWLNKTSHIDPHGREWRNVMWTLGLPATRCHNYDTGIVSGHSQVLRRVSNKGTHNHGRSIQFD